MERHLFIIWEKARYHEEAILDDIKQHFDVLQIYDITWSPDKVSENLTRFYGVNLPKDSDKELECGKGEFKLIIVNDNNPHYEVRFTTKGYKRVNTNIFDAKTKYRAWTNGYKIHASNNPQEYQHDICLLLGPDGDCHFSDDTKTIKLNRDITGCDGWNSIKELFDTLNQTVDYVVLRGEETLIHDTIDENHRDIDILLKDSESAQYIINGVSLTTKRPHELVSINKKEYYLDLWQTNLGYFDPEWEDQMLQTKVHNTFFFSLSDENKLPNLLYHCIIIKGGIASDYFPVIEKLVAKFTTEQRNNVDILRDFLERRGYEITTPLNDSVHIHIDNETLYKYASRHGKLIKRNFRGNNFLVPFSSAVYERQDSFYKRADAFLIKNEKKFLDILKSYDHVPKIIETGQKKDGTYIVISRMPGIDSQHFFLNHKKHTPRAIRSFLKEGLDLLKMLIHNNIMHRDFTTCNLLVDEKKNGSCKLNLIDFGWAKFIDENDVPSPEGLGGIWEYRFNPDNGYSDLYAFGRILNLCIPENITIVKSLQALMEITSTDGNYSAQDCLNILNKAQQIADERFSAKDYFVMFLYRHRALTRYYKKFNRYLLFNPFRHGQ